MKRILLDENIPVGLGRLRDGWDVLHVHQQHWAGISNGELIRKAEEAGFDALVTADQNLGYQQNLTARRLALVVLSTNNWKTMQRNVLRIHACLSDLTAGAFEQVSLR